MMMFLAYINIIMFPVNCHCFWAVDLMTDRHCLPKPHMSVPLESIYSGYTYYISHLTMPNHVRKNDFLMFNVWKIL